jgi:hypothetical protein
MVSKNTIEQKMRSDAYSRFIADALKTSKCTVAVFVNRAFSGSLEQSPLALTRRILAKSGKGTKREHITELPSVDRSHHIFLPFFGGVDGQAAIRLAIQLADNPEITITMVHYMMRPEGTTSEDALTAQGGIVLQEQKQKIRVSTSYDEPEDDSEFFISTQHSLPDSLRTRVTFRTIISYDPVQDAISDAATEIGRNPWNGGDLVMLARNVELVDSNTPTCLGLVADVILEKDIKASVVVVQAGKQ